MDKKIIILIIILVFLGVGGYFLYTKILSPPVVPSVSIVKSVNPQFAIETFSNSKFVSLQNYITLPIKVDSKGKTNPFMKF